MSPKQLIAHFKTQTAAGEVLGLTQPCISNWVRRNRIPELQQLRVEHATNGALTADKKIMPSKRKVSRM